jgi:large subunit ribosomal protein L15
VGKSKKNNKMRGKKSHGHGTKARRGAGKRGGRGLAGGMKHRWFHMNMHYGKKYYGGHGFKRPQSVRREETILNLTDLRENIDRFIEAKAAKKKKKGYDVDIEKMGYTKLLGGGSIGDLEVHVIAPKASSKAVEKVQEAGGTVTIKEK